MSRKATLRATLAERIIGNMRAKLGAKGEPAHVVPIKDFVSRTVDVGLDRLVSAMASFGSESMRMTGIESPRELIGPVLVAGTGNHGLHMLRNDELSRRMVAHMEIAQ